MWSKLTSTGERRVPKRSEFYPVGFAFVICAVASLLLASVSQGLKPMQELNMGLDLKKNILRSVKLTPPVPPHASPREVTQIYTDAIQLAVIDDQGNIVPGKKPDDIKGRQGLYPLFIYQKGGIVQGYCFPIEGKGLWSMLYGYMSIEPDGKTVRGITFYREGETPGLGGEIEALWFQKDFEGKKIWDDVRQQTVPLAVAKGKVQDRMPKEKWPYYVDGISGATLTGKGVSALLENWIRTYEPFFMKLHRN